jgi:hypothetical protein
MVENVKGTRMLERHGIDQRSLNNAPEAGGFAVAPEECLLYISMWTGVAPLSTKEGSLWLRNLRRQRL